MPDLGSISTAIATIKTSMEIAKLIKDSSSSLDEAETKFIHLSYSNSRTYGELQEL